MKKRSHLQTTYQYWFPQKGIWLGHYLGQLQNTDMIAVSFNLTIYLRRKEKIFSQHELTQLLETELA